MECNISRKTFLKNKFTYTSLKKTHFDRKWNTEQNPFFLVFSTITWHTPIHTETHDDLQNCTIFFTCAMQKIYYNFRMNTPTTKQEKNFLNPEYYSFFLLEKKTWVWNSSCVVQLDKRMVYIRPGERARKDWSRLVPGFTIFSFAPKKTRLLAHILILSSEHVFQRESISRILEECSRTAITSCKKIEKKKPCYVAINRLP